jgi:hypothetical protein
LAVIQSAGKQLNESTLREKIIYALCFGKMVILKFSIGSHDENGPLKVKRPRGVSRLREIRRAHRLAIYWRATAELLSLGIKTVKLFTMIDGA